MLLNCIKCKRKDSLRKFLFTLLPDDQIKFNYYLIIMMNKLRTLVGENRQDGARQTGQDDGAYQCVQLDIQGAMCGTYFYSKRAFLCHQRMAKCFGHLMRNQVNYMITTTQCPICLSNFSSMQTCRHHVNRALDTGVCYVDRAFVAEEPEMPESMKCPLNAMCADTIIEGMEGPMCECTEIFTDFKL